MKTSDILLILAVVIALGSLIRIRVMFMLKGVKVMAVVNDYILKGDISIPLMEFEYNGQTIVMKAKGGSKKRKYEIGTEMEALYIPGNDMGVKLSCDYTDIYYIVFFVVVGGFILIASQYI